MSNSKIYNPKSVTALAKYLGVTTATIHNWRRGEHKINGVTVEHPNTVKKFDLIKRGWEQVCQENR